MTTEATECAQDQQPTLCDLELYPDHSDLIKFIQRLWNAALKEEAVNQCVWVDVTTQLNAISVALSSFNKLSCSFELAFLYGIANERLCSAAQTNQSIKESKS